MAGWVAREYSTRPCLWDLTRATTDQLPNQPALQLAAVDFANKSCMRDWIPEGAVDELGSSDNGN